MQIMPYDPSRKQSRGQHYPVAIVLHEVNEPMTSIDAMMQQPISFATSAHRSFHYAVDGSSIHAYVPLDEAVHAIADTDTMTPWPIALANPGVDVDLYTINIAVSIGTLAPMPDPCTPNCGRNYSVTLQHNIQVLLNKIASIRDINITAANVVWKHGTELCDLDVEPLLEPIEPLDPGQEDWLCDRLAALPLGESETPMLVGSDCALYPMPVGGDNDWLIDARGGRHTPTSTATGGNAFAAGTNNEASGSSATVGGGTLNAASGRYATIGGGYSNVASGDYSAAIGGGSNVASGDYSAAIGGYNNEATHIRAVIAGGQNMASVADDTLHCAKLAILNIPTSAAGLASGMIWSDGGTLKIVP